MKAIHFVTEERHTRWKNALRRYIRGAIVSCVLGCVVGIAVSALWVPHRLKPLQKYYFFSYAESAWLSYVVPFYKSQYTMLKATLTDPQTKKEFTLDLNDDIVEPVLDEDGNATFDNQDRPIVTTKLHTKQFFWSVENLRSDNAYTFFKSKIFDGQTLNEVCRTGWFWVLLVSFWGAIVYPVIDVFGQRDYLKGQTIRGPIKVSPRDYARSHKRDTGYGITVHTAEATRSLIILILRLASLLGFAPPSYQLRAPRRAEVTGLLVLGDPGTGKSQILHQLIRLIRRRQSAEAVVVYDPDGEFARKHFNPKTDLIFNPFDDRCVVWIPAFEVNYRNANASAADRKMIAEAFFPDRRYGAPSADFFINAARSIFARILEVEHDLDRIVAILTSEELIDQVVQGTEYAHLISPGAKGQRGGVLATLSEVAESLRLLPRRNQSANEVSLTAWARKRQGRIFITSRHDQRDALGRLQAAWINILTKRLLAAETKWSEEHPCWVIVDEVHALKHLSALPLAITEGRKHGLKLVIGTQNKSQLEQHYGHEAMTMLASFETKIILRCNEPECARWLSDLIGEDETERVRMSTTASVQRHGRDSINYNNVTEHRSVVSKEEIMALPNLQGYWKHGNLIVPFRIEPLELEDLARHFIQRQTSPKVSRVADQPRIARPHENGRETPEIATATVEEIDISF